MRLRPPAPEDLEAVFAVMAAREMADVGLVDYTLEDLREAWQLTGFDLACDARIVEDETGRIVAYGVVHHPGARGMVAPDAEGRGAGSMLLDWLEEREREQGRSCHRQYVASTSASAERLLRTRGFELTRSNWRMVRELDTQIDPPAPPPGVQLRRPVLPADAEALHTVDGRAFSGAPGYEPESLQAFTEEHLLAHNLAVDLSVVAVGRGSDGDGRSDDRILGFALTRRWAEENVGYVAVLAVDPPEQHRGIGRTMLLHAFAATARAGLSEAQLDVSSVNPNALRLYESAGMSPRFRYDIYERPISAPSRRLRSS